VAADYHQIAQFLTRFKKTAQLRIDFINRPKNNSFLAAKGMTPEERKEIILGLEVQHYVDGPEVDEAHPKGPKSVWVFGYKAECGHIYIKVKHYTDNAGIGRAKCLSFHEAEFQLKFPHGGAESEE
jgi:hypothetical protein